MADLIDRAQAIDQLHQSYNLLDAEQRIEELPSAQPDLPEFIQHIESMAYERGKADAQPERKKGEWLGHYTPYECPVCGKYSDDATNYCPHCGTRLEREKDE